MKRARPSSDELGEQFFRLVENCSPVFINEVDRWRILNRVLQAARGGKPFPLEGENPWRFHQMPGWRRVSQALTDKAREYWEQVQKETKR